jgi:tetratricopeptide (TPR) repeat protein
MLGGQHDAEVVRGTYARTFARMRAILESYGGTVEKFIGDAVMAVFGVPIAHEDDALRALRAALDLREHIAQESAHSPMRLELRVGVNSGEVVAGSGRGGEFLVTGKAVNIGARLQSAAYPGEVLVGSLTRELTSTAVRYAEARWIEAKGIGPVEAFAVLDMLTEPAVLSTVPSAALVDREAELHILFDTYERVRTERSPYLVTIYGEAGVGKSRVAREFADRVGPDRVRAGRCLPYGEGVTFAPLQEMVRADLGISAADDAADAAAKLTAVVEGSLDGGGDADVVSRGIAILAGLATIPSVWPDLAAESVASELNYALRRFLEQRSATLPLLLVLEDAHWAEAALLDAIEHLAEWARAPLLILCLARSELVMRRPSWGGGKTRALAMTLDPLSADQTRELVQALLPPARSAHRDEIVRRSEGNPLYVEEFVRRLVQSDQPPTAVPATLHGLIAARLDAVEPALKAMLQRASVSGRVFSTEALTALGEDAREVESRLRTGLRHDFIAATDEQGPGSGREYRFNHMLTRDVAYTSLPKSERARLHDRFGRWLETIGVRRGVEDREIVAYHAEQACLFAREIGLDDAPALGSRAFLMLLAAATSSRDRADYHGSRALFQRAAAIGEASDVDPALLIEARGYAATSRLRLEGSPDALAQLEAVLSDARRLGPSPVLANLLWWSAMYAMPGDAILARARHLEAIAIARAVGDPATVAAALRASAAPAAARGDLDEERSVLHEARSLLEPSVNPTILARVLLGLTNNATRRGDFDEVRAHMQEALPLAQDVVGRILAQRSKTEYLRALGDLDEATQSAELALAAARELGSPVAVAGAASALGCVLRQRRRLEPSRAVLEDALVVARGSADKIAFAQLRSELARTLLALDDVQGARRCLEDGEIPSTDVGITAAAKATLAQIFAAEGRREQADKLFRQAVALLEPTGLALDLAERRLERALFLVDSGRGAEARPLLAAVRDFFAHSEATRRKLEVETLLRKSS